MKITELPYDVELLLWTISGLVEQAHREPENHFNCISMIRTVITRARERICPACNKHIGSRHKTKHTKKGLAHLHCEWPKSYLSEAQFAKTFGKEALKKNRKK